MWFKVMSTTDKDKFKADLLQMLKNSDKDFVPPLSSRRSTTQSDFSLSGGSEDGILNYYNEMNNQQILGVLDEDKLIAFVSYKEDYLSEQVTGGKLPNIYVSTLLLKPEARGKHLTYRIYDYLFNTLYPNSSVFTRTWSTNIAHIKILDKFGFENYITKVNDRGDGIDTVYFRKLR